MDALKESTIKEEQVGMDLNAWLRAVNVISVRLLGIDTECLPDWHWASAHEDGLTPREAFDAFHEDEFGDSFEAINGRSGVGA